MSRNKHYVSMASSGVTFCTNSTVVNIATNNSGSKRSLDSLCSPV